MDSERAGSDRSMCVPKASNGILPSSRRSSRQVNNREVSQHESKVVEIENEDGNILSEHSVKVTLHSGGSQVQELAIERADLLKRDLTSSNDSDFSARQAMIRE